MAALVWIGALLTLGGLGGLGYCVAVALRARREGLEGAEMEARLRGLVPVNLGSLAISTLGLIMVVLGVFLG
jgi:hypothetical protein